MEKPLLIHLNTRERKKGLGCCLERHPQRYPSEEIQTLQRQQTLECLNVPTYQQESNDPLCHFTSKGSYRSWKKTVKVWIMLMKEGIFASHPSLALPPSTLPCLPLPHLPLPCLPSTCLPLPRSTHPCPTHPCKMKWQNGS